MPITLTNVTDTSLNVNRITVTVAFASGAPTGCSVSEFAVGGDSIAGSPPTIATSGGTTTITLPAVQPIAAQSSWTYHTNLALPDNHAIQNGCAGQGLTLTFQGDAVYTLLTTTGLSLSQNAGTDSETLTATVSPTDTTPAAAGHTPADGACTNASDPTTCGDGAVKFLSCPNASDPSSCATLGTSRFSSTGVANLSIPAGTVGTDNLQAVFVPADPTSFVGSSSKIITQALTGCVTAKTSTAGNVMAAGTTYTGNYEVMNGSSLWLNGGTVTGNVTVDPGGQFAASGGMIGGNLQSNGGAIALSGTTVSGNVQTQGGGLSLGPSTFVKGNVQASGGGPFCSQGGSSTQSQVQVRGNLIVQSETSPTTSSVCSTNVGNNLIWQSNTSPGVLGSCGGNMILGNLQVQNNSGTVTVGASGSGNTTTGNIIVQSNTGGGTLTGNGAGGNCLMSTNKPGIAGSGNTAKGKNNQCNATA